MTTPADASLAEELAIEQAHLDVVYRRLDQHRATAREQLTDVLAGGGDARTHQARSERDTTASLWADRRALLEQGEERLCFGRLDLIDGTTIWIGRLTLFGDGGEVVLTDWRAPAAAPFYRATAVEPMGVARRRRLVTRDRQIVGIDDDLVVDQVSSSGSAEPSGAPTATRDRDRCHDRRHQGRTSRSGP